MIFDVVRTVCVSRNLTLFVLTLTQINVVRGAEPIVVRATSMLHSYSKSMKSFITCDEAICNSWWV